MTPHFASAAAIAIAAAIAVGRATATPVAFPASGSWEGMRLEAKAADYGAVVDAGGAAVASLRVVGGSLSDVDVSLNPERISIDASHAFAKGARSIVLETPVLSGIEAYAGKDVAFATTVLGHGGMQCRSEVVGLTTDADGKRGWYVFDNGPGWRVALSRTEKRRFATLGDLKPGVSDLRFRFTVEKQGAGPVELFGIGFGTAAELGVKTEFDYPPQKRLFHAAFDGTADAESADGSVVKPLGAEGLEFAEGRRGLAVRLSPKSGSRLEYPFPGNVLPEQGTFASWVKSENGNAVAKPQCLFAFGPSPGEKARPGSGQKRAIWKDGSLRVDSSDDFDSFRTFPAACLDGAWHHIVVTWTPGGVWTMVDGMGAYRGGSSAQLFKSLTPVNPLSFSRPADFASLCIGGEDGGSVFEGLIDDVEVFAVPMTPAKAREHFFAHGGELPPRPDYAAIFDAHGGNPYEAKAPATVPGELELEFVEEVRLDNPAPCERFRAVGSVSVRELGSVKYLEGGAGQDDRFAVGFTLDSSEYVSGRS